MSNFAGHLPVRYYLLLQSLLYQGSTDEPKSCQNLRPLNRADLLGPASLWIPGFESNSPIFTHSHHETIIKFCTGSLVTIKITFVKWIFWKEVCCLTHWPIKLKLKDVTEGFQNSLASGVSQWERRFCPEDQSEATRVKSFWNRPNEITNIWSIIWNVKFRSWIKIGGSTLHRGHDTFRWSAKVLELEIDI